MIRRTPMHVAAARFRRLVVALSIGAAAGGCGYQLRGGASHLLPPGGVRVEGPAGIAEPIRHLLEGAQTRTRPADETAGLRLLLGGETFSRRVLSVDPRTGKESEFELSYHVAFRVLDARGEGLVPQQTVKLFRDYVFDPNAVAGKSHEERVLHAEMRRDAAGRILSRIEAALRR